MGQDFGLVISYLQLVRNSPMQVRIEGVNNTYLFLQYILRVRGAQVLDTKQKNSKFNTGRNSSSCYSFVLMPIWWWLSNIWNDILKKPLCSSFWWVFCPGINLEVVYKLPYLYLPALTWIWYCASHMIF